MPRYQVAVVGVGAAGSAAFYHLAARGISVIGIDQFEPGHGCGSSHGETRVIRTAYHEHPDYVPLLQRAIPLWKALEEEAGESLYTPVGCLEVGPPDGEVIQGVLTSAKLHGLSVEQLTAKEIEERFPGFKVPDGMVGTYEREGGVLAVEPCIRAHARLGVKRGGVLWENTRVLGMSGEKGEPLTLDTGRGQVQAEQVIVSTGAWAGEWFPQLPVPLEIRRKPLVWFAAEKGAYGPKAGSPVFLYQVPQGLLYGFPAMEDGEVKVALHSGGDSYERPEDLDRNLMKEDSTLLAALVGEWLPSVNASEVVRGDVCMYTMTPDEHFLVGQSPEDYRVWMVAGLSGHGFKFSSVLGESLCQWVCDGESRLSLEVFNPQRFA